MPEKRYARRDPNEIVDIEHRDRLEDYYTFLQIG